MLQNIENRIKKIVLDRDFSALILTASAHECTTAEKSHR